MAADNSWMIGFIDDLSDMARKRGLDGFADDLEELARRHLDAIGRPITRGDAVPIRPETSPEGQPGRVVPFGPSRLKL